MRNPGSNTVSGNVEDKFLSLDERLMLAPDRYRNWRGHERMHTPQSSGAWEKQEGHRRLVEQVSIQYRYSNTESPQRMNEIGQ